MLRKPCSSGSALSFLSPFELVQAQSFDPPAASDPTMLSPPRRDVPLTHLSLQNASGQFQLLSLVIDVPSSSVPHPGRAVVFWSPEADTEGLQGRIR